MQQFFDHCELLRRMNYCTNFLRQQTTIAATPLAESTPSPNPQMLTPEGQNLSGRTVLGTEI